MNFGSLFGRGGINNDDDDINNNDQMLEQSGTSSGTGTIRRNPNANPNEDILKQAAENSKNSKGMGGPAAGRITLYANGFALGEGDDILWFPTQHDRSNPSAEELQANQRHLDDIRNGFVPKVLEDQIRAKAGLQGNNQQVPVSLDDKTSETYEPPFKSFTGSGNSLKANKTVANLLQGVGPAPIPFDDSQPKTKIQVVKGRERKVVQINMNATVGQLYQHVLHIFSIGYDIQLVAGGQPPRVLNEMTPTMSIEEADLKRARIEIKEISVAEN